MKARVMVTGIQCIHHYSCLVCWGSDFDICDHSNKLCKFITAHSTLAVEILDWPTSSQKMMICCYFCTSYIAPFFSEITKLSVLSKLNILITNQMCGFVYYMT